MHAVENNVDSQFTHMVTQSLPPLPRNFCLWIHLYRYIPDLSLRQKLRGTVVITIATHLYGAHDPNFDPVEPPLDEDGRPLQNSCF